MNAKAKHPITRSYQAKHNKNKSCWKRSNCSICSNPNVLLDKSHFKIILLHILNNQYRSSSTRKRRWNTWPLILNQAKHPAKNTCKKEATALILSRLSLTARQIIDKFRFILVSRGITIHNNEQNHDYRSSSTWKRRRKTLSLVLVKRHTQMRTRAKRGNFCNCWESVLKI